MSALGTLKRTGLLFGLLIVLFPASSLALSQDQLNVYDSGIYYFDTSTSAGDCSAGGGVLQGSDNEEQTWNYFKGQGLSDAQTAGIMGNIEQESSFGPERMEIGGNSQNPYDALGQGWGIVQWTGDNKTTLGDRTTGDKVTAIYNQTGSTGPVYELGTQLAMVWAEMNGTSPTGVQNMIAGLKLISDPAQAAAYFDTNFEGGTDPNGIRETNASNILGKYAGMGSSGSTGTSYPCVTTSSGICNANGIVYDAEYSQQQLAAIFGNPGTATSHPAMDANLTTVDFLGHSVQVNKLIASCLQAVATDWTNNHISYQIQSMGCYRFDSNNGTSNIGLSSYHTYGAACDINPLTNNYYDTGNNGTRSYNPNCPASSGAVNSGNCYDMPPQVVQIFAAHGFYWGGNFNSIKDYMHFEWHGVIP